MPAVYQLLAFPGTGKLTIAKEIVKQLEARGEPCARLDNHATHNLVWQLIPEARKFDTPVLARVLGLRRVLLEAAAELTSGSHSIVFTNFLPPSRRPQRGRRSLTTASARGAMARIDRNDTAEIRTEATTMPLATSGAASAPDGRRRLCSPVVTVERAAYGLGAFATGARVGHHQGANAAGSP